MSETTQGRRVPTFDDIELAGDYCLGQIEEQGVVRPFVWFLLPIHQGTTKFDHPTPGSGIHGIGSPPWKFRECDDGSLEIRASIACGRHDPTGEYWHGFLNEGNQWTTA